MTGLCGLFRRDGAPVPPESLTPTLEALAHYGDRPPAAWHDGPIALGAVVNALTPQDAHTPQPITRGPLTIAADARLDNRADLFAALDVPSALHAGISDAALIGMAYARWGEGCADHLIGDFAFAVWDSDQHQLFLARDAIGARALYYSRTATTFAFASELAVLLDMPAVQTGIDEVEIARMLLTRANFVQTEMTFWRDVMPLPFGCTLTVRADDHRQRRYFDFTARKQIRFAQPGEYADALYALVETAVRDRLRLADGIGVGAHCSGGVDSSSIAALVTRARRAAGQPAPPWYSWSPPPQPGADLDATEHRRIVRLAEREGAHVTYAAAHNPLDFDPTRYPLNTLGIEAGLQPVMRADGVRVLFSGWGGDETVSFNGRGLAAERLITLRWSALARQLRLSEARRGWPAARRAARRLLDSAIVPALPDVLLYGALTRTPPSYIHPDLLRRMAGRRPEPFTLRERAGVHAMQRHLLLHGHITERMACWSWAGARHGITYVYPLADRRLIEFALGVPSELSLREGYGRWLYRAAMARLLGDSFVWDRIKEDTALFAHFAARREESLARRAAADAPAPAHALLALDCPWVDMPRLRAALDDESARTMRSPEGARRGTALLALEIWSRHGHSRSS